jgi:hypothetical protein
MENLLDEFEAKCDLHRDRIMFLLGLDPHDAASGPRFTQAMAQAKDLGAERGLSILPVRERRHWWTAAPTDDVAILAEDRRVLATAAEWRRLFRVTKARRLPVSNALALSARNQMLAVADTIDTLRPASDRVDACLERIDARIRQNRKP